MTTATLAQPEPTRGESWLTALNGRYHEISLKVFMIVVLAHWAEHIIQAIQIYGLGWPRPESRGLLGQFYPWLVRSETLHFGYAVVMFLALLLLLPGFRGRSRTWWTISLVIQGWHLFEHALLQAQAAAQHNLFGQAVPTSIAQLLIPRVELHLIYNAIVFIPMVIAMYYHLYPPAGDAADRAPTCTCARRPLARTAEE